MTNRDSIYAHLTDDIVDIVDNVKPAAPELSGLLSTLSIPKPAFRIHSAQQASNRVSSVIVAALYPLYLSWTVKPSTCGVSQRSRSGYNLCSIHRPLREGEDLEFNGRKLRQNLTKAERDALDRSGSLSYKSAGAKRVRKADDSDTVKESDDAQADRENAMQGLVNPTQRLNDAIRAHLNRPMSKSFTDDKMWTTDQFRYRG